MQMGDGDVTVVPAQDPPSLAHAPAHASQGQTVPMNLDGPCVTTLIGT